jgi:hypothetical protein
MVTMKDAALEKPEVHTPHGRQPRPVAACVRDEPNEFTP